MTRLSLAFALALGLAACVDEPTSIPGKGDGGCGAQLQGDGSCTPQ